MTIRIAIPKDRALDTGHLVLLDDAGAVILSGSCRGKADNQAAAALKSSWSLAAILGSLSERVISSSVKDCGDFFRYGSAVVSLRK